MEDITNCSGNMHSRCNSILNDSEKIVGATKPSESAPGTIPGDFAVEVERSIIHGSDSVENARKGKALWFPAGTVNWQSSLRSWIYE
ncbi:Nucleoside diphosphate kinase B, putative [Ricinus communis]|uniref:nucleoside-diphosphate kinase n=1 Tax=Ricinus communis TaxID=3988 RepID=B9RA00_RICCO|nr:Nucleoside diphosphate kinase B, putative [Ricinus communis]